VRVAPPLIGYDTCRQAARIRQITDCDGVNERSSNGLAGSMQQKDDAVLEARKAKLKPPPMFKVMLLNDDYTPMEFVVLVLQKFFA
jgi:hypothetical protein